MKSEKEKEELSQESAEVGQGEDEAVEEMIEAVTKWLAR
jgi:hypothetical protein